MSLASLRPVIDSSECKGCGACTRVCPHRSIRLVEGTARLTGPKCMQCGHCVAACPQNAIFLAGTAPPRFSSFTAPSGWTPPGGVAPEQLAGLLLSRRSCRQFVTKPVPQHLLEDIISFAVTAPSGTNSQEWTFTVLPDRPAVEALAQNIALFFRRLNTLASRGWLRNTLKFIGKHELHQYYTDYQPAVADALQRWEEHGEDLLFHSAPAVLLVSCRSTASCPAEDALLAAAHGGLGAHALGLGTCLVGYAVAALQRDASITRRLGLADDETVYAAIAVGWPAEQYARPAGRRQPLVRWVGKED